MFGNKNKKIVTDFLDAFVSGDAASVTSFLDDNVVWQAMGSVGGEPMSTRYNKKEIGDLAAKMKNTTANGLTLTPSAWTCEGDRVAVEAEGTATISATGKGYDNLYHFLFIVENGKITEVKEYMDTLHVKNVFIDK